MRIRFACHGLAASGYGEAARAYVSALVTAGHDVSVALLGQRPTERATKRFGRLGELLIAQIDRPLEAIDANIVFAIPPQFKAARVRGTVNIGMSTCETSHIPPARADDCRAMDATFVMSEADRRAFAASSVPATAIPMPADERDYPERIPNCEREPGPFEFVSIGTWTGRKNFKALLAAYCYAFEPKDPVRLTIKTLPYPLGAPEDDAARIERDVRQITDSFRRELLPSIRIHAVRETRQQTIDLLRGSDCYVSAHCGEGWGLPIFEAMAVGLPAIATGWGGPLDFMKPGDGAFLVEYRFSPVMQEERAIAYDLGMKWADVSILDLAERMRFVVHQRERLPLLGQRARLRTLREFSPSVVAARFTEAIERVIRRRAA